MSTEEVSELVQAFDAIPVTEPVAEEAPKKRKAKTEQVTEQVSDAPVANAIFRSREEEGGAFRFMGVRPVRNPDWPGLLEWVMPASLGDKAMKHHHVLTGRIRKAN